MQYTAGSYVRNTLSGVVHRVALGYPAAPETWSTSCGWLFALALRTEHVEELPAHFKDLCKACRPEERLRTKAGLAARLEAEQRQG